MSDINVLFSSVGRRVELVKSFRKAKEKLNIGGKLIGIDMDKTAPAFYFLDKNYIVQGVLETGFIDEVIRICNLENIHLIIPTIDTELLIYSKYKSKIESNTNAKVMISDYSTISIIRDKIKTANYFLQFGIDVPRVLTEIDIEKKNFEYPLFIKPLDGSSSIDNYKIHNEIELNFFTYYINKPIIQEFISGKEYCVDVFCDFNGQVISVTPKLRLGYRAGEITKGIIEKDLDIIEMAKKIARNLPFIGEFNFDCIKTDRKIYLIEINGRFAGGSPMSFYAGSNSPLNLYKLLQGEQLTYSEDYSDGLLCLRFDDCIYL